jgi:integrase/recombinase XerC
LANELKRSKKIIFDKEYEEDINPENLKLLQKYKIDMEIRDLSPKSIYNFERDLKQWMSYLVKEQFNISVKEVTENDIEEFIYFCKQQGNNVERIKRRISPISAFYKFLRKKKEIVENPCEFIVRPKRGLPVVTQTFLSFEQFDLMKERLSKQSDLQLYVFAMVAIDTMGRVNALANLTWKQIDYENRCIDNVLEKEGKIVSLYFGEDTMDLLKQLKQYREDNKIDDGGYLFFARDEAKISNTTLSAWTRKIGDMIDVPTFHPHDLRHSGSQLRKLKGMKLEDISTLLNHSSTDVTCKFYLRQDKKEMRDKMDQFKL